MTFWLNIELMNKREANIRCSTTTERGYDSFSDFHNVFSHHGKFESNNVDWFLMNFLKFVKRMFFFFNF